MFIKFLALDKVFYIVVGFLIIAYSYSYVGKNYPHIKLPYKERIFKIERLLVEKIDFFINKYEKESK